MKTLAQIAREMGVSTATVSYVFNDKWRENRITPELARRIRDKIATDRAGPNLLARQLSTGKTQLAGVVLADLTAAYNLDLLAGLEKVLAGADYLALLCNTSCGQHEERHLLNLLQRGTDGIILCPQTAQPLAELTQAGAPPVVLIDNYYAGETAFDYFISDNAWGASQLVEHLVARGCRRFVYYGATRHLASTVDRFNGYAEALKRLGLATDAALRSADDPDALAQRLDRPAGQRPDAIFVSSLMYFAAGFRLLAERDLRIGQDLAVVGFDRTPPEQHPPAEIPQAVQAAETMGELAAKQLLARLADPKTPGQQVRLRPVIENL